MEILAHGLADEKSALRVEAAVIDAVGLKGLWNLVRGWHAGRTGRVPLSDLIAMYDRRRVEVKEPAILVRINQRYRADMTAGELYDATRGVWKIGRKHASAAKLALAVFEGIVREVYEVIAWLPAGSTFSSRAPQGVQRRGRWEFVGRVAPDKIRSRYVDRYVGHLFAYGHQSPIRYINIPDRTRHPHSRAGASKVPFIIPLNG